LSSQTTNQAANLFDRFDYFSESEVSSLWADMRISLSTYLMAILSQHLTQRKDTTQLQVKKVFTFCQTKCKPAQAQ